MNKWILIAMALLLTLMGCTANRAVPEQPKAAAEAYTGITTKVAILPLKAMDSQSRYIQKILTVRDLDIAFDKHPKYNLMDMTEVAYQFKLSGYKDVDDLELEEMKELAEMTNTDVLAMGSLTTLRSDSYSAAMRLYSQRTGELRQLNFVISKYKEQRWEALETSLIGELDKFISTEVDKIFNIAINYYSSGNYTEAEKSLVMAMGLNPDLKDANYYLGSTYFKAGKMDEAVVALNKNLALDPNHQQSLNTLMELYQQTNKPVERLNVMEKMATLNSDEDMWLAIGNLWVEQNNIPKAEAALKQAIALDPEFAIAQSRLALLLYDEGRFADSIPYLEYAFDRFPENDLISRRLASAYQRTGRLSEAVAKYELLIKNNPQSVQPYLNVVGLYRIQASEATDPKIVAEINQKAINMMKELTKIQPDNALAYMNLATIYLGQSKFAEVETNANLAIQKDPTLYLPFVYLSTVSQNKGTADYNRFADLEQKAAKAVGKQANALKKERDNARAAANNNFRKAAEQLGQAKSRTTDTEALNDINSRLNRVNNLISSSSGY